MDGAKGQNGDHKDSPDATSAVLTDVIVTPDSSAGSDAGDDAGEDRPLLHFGRP